MNIRHISLMLMLAVVASVMTSCSKRGELLDTIPADASIVALIDVKKICSESGVDFTDRGTPAGQETDRSFYPVLPLDVLARLDSEGVADMSEVALFAEASVAHSYITFLISDFDKFKEITAGNVEWGSDAEGYHVGKAEESMMNIIASKKQVWYTHSTPKDVKVMEAAAKKNPIGKIDAIANALRGDGLIDMALKGGNFMALLGMDSKKGAAADDDTWCVAKILNGADGSLVAEWNNIESTGQAVKPCGLKNINPALLAYVPEDYTMTFGIGIGEGFNWEPVEQLAMAFGGFQGAAFMSAISPYLQSIDGSVILAARPKADSESDEINPMDWDFIALARMPREKIRGLMNMVRTMAFTAGITPSVDEKTGIMALPQYGGTMYIGDVDGNLGISTQPFDNTRNNSLAPVFVNKDMAASFTFEPDPHYFNGDAGGVPVEITASMDGSQGQAKVRLTGVKGSALSYIFSHL